MKSKVLLSAKQHGGLKLWYFCPPRALSPLSPVTLHLEAPPSSSATLSDASRCCERAPVLAHVLSISLSVMGSVGDTDLIWSWGRAPSRLSKESSPCWESSGSGASSDCIVPSQPFFAGLSPHLPTTAKLCRFWISNVAVNIVLSVKGSWVLHLML